MKKAEPESPLKKKSTDRQGALTQFANENGSENNSKDSRQDALPQRLFSENPSVKEETKTEGDKTTQKFYQNYQKLVENQANQYKDPEQFQVWQKFEELFRLFKNDDDPFAIEPVSEELKDPFAEPKVEIQTAILCKKPDMRESLKDFNNHCVEMKITLTPPLNQIVTSLTELSTEFYNIIKSIKKIMVRKLFVEMPQSMHDAFTLLSKRTTLLTKDQTTQLKSMLVKMVKSLEPIYERLKEIVAQLRPLFTSLIAATHSVDANIKSAKNLLKQSSDLPQNEKKVKEKLEKAKKLLEGIQASYNKDFAQPLKTYGIEVEKIQPIMKGYSGQFLQFFKPPSGSEK